MLRVAWSVCWLHGCTVRKRVNWLRCCLRTGCVSKLKYSLCVLDDYSLLCHISVSKSIFQSSFNFINFWCALWHTELNRFTALLVNVCSSCLVFQYFVAHSLWIASGLLVVFVPLTTYACIEFHSVFSSHVVHKSSATAEIADHGEAKLKILWAHIPV